MHLHKRQKTGDELPKDVFLTLFGNFVPQATRTHAATLIQRAYRRWRNAWEIPVCVDIDGTPITEGSIVQTYRDLQGSYEPNLSRPGCVFQVKSIRWAWGWGRYSIFFWLNGVDESEAPLSKPSKHVRLAKPMQCHGCEDHFSQTCLYVSLRQLRLSPSAHRI